MTAHTCTVLTTSMKVGKGFNRDAWAKLEGHVRQLTHAYSNVFVCTGPLYIPEAGKDGKTYMHYQARFDAMMQITR